MEPKGGKIKKFRRVRIEFTALMATVALSSPLCAEPQIAAAEDANNL